MNLLTSDAAVKKEGEERIESQNFEAFAPAKALTGVPRLHLTMQPRYNW